MNAKQKLHQAKLSDWSEIFKAQASSGLTAKEWCCQNSVSIHAFNYWKHQLKENVVDALLPDIVPVNTAMFDPYPVSNESRNSRNSHNLRDQSAVLTISYNDIHIRIGASVSDEQILRMIQAVRYA